MTDLPTLTVAEARRLHNEAANMTVKKLRQLGKHYFKCEWMSNARKKVIVKGFRLNLEVFLMKNGEKP